MRDVTLVKQIMMKKVLVKVKMMLLGFLVNLNESKVSVLSSAHQAES